MDTSDFSSANDMKKRQWNHIQMCVCVQKTLFSRFYYGWNQSFHLMGLLFHTLNCCPSISDVLQTGSNVQSHNAGSWPLADLDWVYNSNTVLCTSVRQRGLDEIRTRIQLTMFWTVSCQWLYHQMSNQNESNCYSKMKCRPIRFGYCTF